MAGAHETRKTSMTVALVCYACRYTRDAKEVFADVHSLYLFGVMMKFELRYYVWDTSCSDCGA
jgi:hypothetical protein